MQNVQVPQILLLGNPLVCDCHLEWLPSINIYGVEAPSSHDHLKVMDLAELECQLSHEKNFEEFMLVTQVRLHSLRFYSIVLKVSWKFPF